MKIPIIFFVLIALKISAWILLVPPWQAPDEPTHFEYATSLAQTDFNLHKASESDRDLAHSIYYSMLRHRYWLLTQIPNPERFPERLELLPLLEYGGTKLGKPPFGYLVYALLIRLIQPKTIEHALFLCRVLSGIFTFCIILITFLFCRSLFPAQHALAYSSAMILSLNPQFMHINTSMSTDVVVNLLSTILIYVSFLLLYRGYRLSFLTITGMILILLFFTKKSAWIICIALCVILWDSGIIRKLRRTQIIISLSAFVILWIAITELILPAELKKHLLQDSMRTLEPMINLLFSPSSILIPHHIVKSFLQSSVALFGWMTLVLYEWCYWIELLGVLSAVVSFWWYYRNQPQVREKQVLRALCILVGVCFAGIWIRAGWTDKAMQGRYAFLMYSALSIILATGIHHLRYISIRRLVVFTFLIFDCIATYIAIDYFYFSAESYNPGYRAGNVLKRLTFSLPNEEIALEADVGASAARAVLPIGFYDDEKNGEMTYAWARWQSSIYVYPFGGWNRKVRLRACPFLGPGETDRTLRFAFNPSKSDITLLPLHNSWKWYEVAFSTIGENRIDVAADHEQRPNSADPRLLAWALDTLIVSNIQAEPQATIVLTETGVGIAGKKVFSFEFRLIPEIETFSAVLDPQFHGVISFSAPAAKQNPITHLTPGQIIHWSPLTPETSVIRFTVEADETTAQPVLQQVAISPAASLRALIVHIASPLKIKTREVFAWFVLVSLVISWIGSAVVLWKTMSIRGNA